MKRAAEKGLGVLAAVVVATVAMALDGVALAALLAGGAVGSRLLDALVLHVGLAALSGVAIERAAPRHLRAEAWLIGVTGFILALFVPVFGSLGVVTALFLGARRPEGTRDEPWVILDSAPRVLSRDRRERPARRPPSVAEVSAILQNRTEETKATRFRALVATQRFPPKVAVPLLTRAQTDPSEEIRLYAFSRLERLRNEIERQIAELREALARVGSEGAASVHVRLAERHWELAYLGLAEGIVLEQAVEDALRHARLAASLSPGNAPAEFLVGRILTHRREPGRAARAFARAIEAGYPRIKVLPYLAECAFHERDQHGVRRLLRELSMRAPDSRFPRDVVSLWVGADETEGARRARAAGGQHEEVAP